MNILRRPLALAAAVASVGLAANTQTASAEFQQQDWEFRLSGFAQNDVEFDGFQANVAGSAGYFFSDQFQAGVRQDFQYQDLAGTALNGATAVFLNYHLGDTGGPVQPFVGGSIGFAYGDTTVDTFFAGPEAGIKYFFPETDQWFIFGQVEYQFFFEDGGDADETFDDGTFEFASARVDQ
ncbi:MAG: hypothetical protein AAGK78_11660, partial [Planctomycetota bacterium]